MSATRKHPVEVSSVLWSICEHVENVSHPRWSHLNEGVVVLGRVFGDLQHATNRSIDELLIKN